MKLSKLLLLVYGFVFIVTVFMTFLFVRTMFFNKKTAIIVILVTSLILIFMLIFVNYVLINPILKTILELQSVSKKNAKGKFTTIDTKSFVAEINLLLSDYNQMVRQLEEQLVTIIDSEKEKREMIANLSHDIKTPVSSLIVLGQAISDDILKDYEKNYYYQTVIDNAQRIADLSDELFQLVQSEENQSALIYDRVLLDEILIRVLNAFKGSISLSEREIIVEGTNYLKPVYSNESFIFRILYNIIDNSLKYSKVGTPIYINVEQKTYTVQISITDYGDGIPETEQDKIFHRTYRLEKSRNQITGGHGLGLSISQKLLEKIGGKITVSSKVGKGSTFYIEIPCNDVPQVKDRN